MAFSVTAHLAVPVQAPVQFAKTEPDLGVAVRVTTVPLANLALQTVGQLIPVGLLATVPVPAPAFFTVRVKVVASIVLVQSDDVLHA